MLVHNSQFCAGDFHFLWECLHYVLGSSKQNGITVPSTRVSVVDKGVKVFNVSDEFLMHAFKAHFTASILTLFGTSTPDDDVQHEPTKEWLFAKSDEILKKSVVHVCETGTDPAYTMHRLFMHHAFQYVDLREEIRWENGPVIVQHWKSRIPLFLAPRCKSYACEAITFLTRQQASQST